MTSKAVDCLIIGGSHAGLSAALTLYRAQHTCIILDNQSPRNSYSTPVHLVSTWEHKNTESIKNHTREELQATNFVTFVNAAVAKIEKTADGFFQAFDKQGESWLGRTVLLSTGSKDIFPDIKGYDQLYAKRIYQCMFQFGFEHRGVEHAGLLAVDGLANVFHASMLADDGNKFASKITIYTNSNPALKDELSKAIQTADITLDDRKIVALSEGPNGAEVKIDFGDGSSAIEGFIIHRPDTELDRTLVDQLGLQISDRGDIVTMPPFCQTDVPGVYAAGDCASPAKIIPNALSMGAYAGCGISRELPRRVTGNAVM